MPTLRDDINEAIERASLARGKLVYKVQHKIDWDKNDKIIAIEGLDSLIDLAEEVLPYIPRNVAKQEDRLMAQGGIPVVKPDANQGNRAYTAHVKMSREDEHSLFTFHNVRSIQGDDGEFITLISKDGTTMAAFHVNDVLGAWMDVPEYKGAILHTWEFKWNADGVVDDKLAFENIVISADGSRWMFMKTDDRGNHSPVGWALTGALVRFMRIS